MLKHVKELVALGGISGNESAVREYILQVLKTSIVPVEWTVDALGNLLVTVKGEKPASRRVLFDAHMDEVGMLVTGITADGSLRFATVGGIDEKVLLGSRVRVNGHIGVIGCGAMHLCSKEERNKVISADRLLIDIGADSREEAEAVVTVGDAVLLESEFTSLYGTRFKARALDDRVGCALLLSLLEKPLPYDILLAFTVQEEIGTRGAGVAAYTMAPDVAVAVETTTASDVAGTKPGEEVCHLGKGAVLSFMDRHTLYDVTLYKQITTMAEKAGVCVQPKKAVAGGNNAGALQRAGHGARVAAVSLPCRYIHSPSSVLDEKDVEETARLLRLLAETLPGDLT